MLKPKLPRKRKKACIKAEGRGSYYQTIGLAKEEGESPCKFWKEVENATVLIGGMPVPMPVAVSYW